MIRELDGLEARFEALEPNPRTAFRSELHTALAAHRRQLAITFAATAIPLAALALTVGRAT